MRLALDRCRPQAAQRPAPAAHLRRDDDLAAVAAVGHPSPDDCLREAVFDEVGVGGVYEVAAAGGVRIEYGVGLCFIGSPAEHVATEADGEYLEVGAPESCS